MTYKVKTNRREEALSTAGASVREGTCQQRKKVLALQKDLSGHREQAKAHNEQTMADLLHSITER